MKRPDCEAGRRVDTEEETLTLRPYFWKILALCGFALVGMGPYFVLLRPAMLAEDARYIGTTSHEILRAFPDLANWLNKAFWVMGGYILTTGLLTFYVAAISFRARARGAFAVAGLAGVTSVDWMTFVNFLIDSDFKWLLLVLAALWASALLLLLLEN
jgi:hypothetical protein